MPSDVVANRLLPDRAQELIELMDDYGTTIHVYVSVTDSANRQAYINTATAKQNANQAALEAYAATHGIDLTAQKAAGLAKKAAAKKPTGSLASLYSAATSAATQAGA